MDTRSKPTFVLLGHPIMFDNMLFAPSCASYVCLPLFGIFRQLVFQHAFLLFVYLLVCQLVACTHMEQGRLKQGCDLLGASKKGKDANPQRAMFSRLWSLALPKRFSLSLSLSLFPRACIRVPPLHVPLYFSCSILGLHSLSMAMFVLHSCILLGHTLRTLAMSILLSCPT